MGFIKKFATEFKEFALKGSVVDMAIGVIIGAAFKDIVTSFTDNFISPLINSIGGANIAGSIRLPWVDYSNMALEDVQKLSLNYGAFISAIINFLIMALSSRKRSNIPKLQIYQRVASAARFHKTPHIKP